MQLVERSFRQRIVVGFALLIAIICALLSVIVVFTFEAIEDYLFSQKLEAELLWQVARIEPGEIPDMRPGRHFFNQTTAPAEYLALAPGYHDLEQGRTATHVWVLDQDGQRFILTSDESDFEDLERVLYQSLVAGWLLCLGISIGLGRLTAGRIIAPVTALANAVLASRPEHELPGLQAPDEIGALARAFAARSVELKGFLTRERLFTGDVSHELRTPLTVSLGAAELISAQAENPVVLAAAERIRRATTDMTERVDAFLLLSRTPDLLDAPRISMREVLSRELERHQSQLAGKPVDLEVALPSEEVFVHARPELVAIAVGNLLRNAFQYTASGYVAVRLSSIQLIVEDSGPGLPESVRSRLFERFVRGDNEQMAGSGLGFAITRRITEHLGWQLSLEDPPAGGSRFVLGFSTVQGLSPMPRGLDDRP
jgi:signal transduction histidine kinase